MIFENGAAREKHTPYHGNIFTGGGGAEGSAPFSGFGGNGGSIPITFGGQESFWWSRIDLRLTVHRCGNCC